MFSPYAVQASNQSQPKYSNQESTLYVNNIDPSIDKIGLSNHFCRYGTVLSIKLNKDSASTNKSYGYVVFANVNQAETARQKLQYKKLGNCEIIVMFVEDKNKLKQEGKIFIKNIPDQVSHLELHTHFSKVSPGLIVHIASDENSKSSLHYGYAHYFDPEDAREALRQLQGSKLGNEHLELSQWVGKDDRHLQTQEKRNLYIGNIPVRDKITLEKELRTIFDNYGDIESLVLQKSDKAQFYSALLCYVKADDAQIAHNTCNSYPKKLVGSAEPLLVNWYQSKEERKKERQKEPAKDNLYLRNLKMTTTEEQLRNLFGAFGEIKDLEMRVWSSADKKTQAKFAFVSYKDPQCAELALDLAPGDGAIQELFTSVSNVYIRFFMSKDERKQEVKVVQQSRQNKVQQSQQRQQIQVQPQMQVQAPYKKKSHAQVPAYGAQASAYGAPAFKEFKTPLSIGSRNRVAESYNREMDAAPQEKSGFPNSLSNVSRSGQRGGFARAEKGIKLSNSNANIFGQSISSGYVPYSVSQAKKEYQVEENKREAEYEDYEEMDYKDSQKMTLVSMRMTKPAEKVIMFDALRNSKPMNSVPKQAVFANLDMNRNPPLANEPVYCELDSDRGSVSPGKVDDATLARKVDDATLAQIYAQQQEAELHAKKI